MAQDKSDSSFRVIDRRLFTEKGELRPEAQEQAQREKETPAPAATPAKPAAAAVPEKPAPARSPYFDLLVRSLANQAAMLLTGMPDPATGQAFIDIDGAREVIDMLDVLREKTRGNLAPEEDRLLTDMLGQLKFSYLEVSKAAAASAANPGGAKKTGARR